MDFGSSLPKNTIFRPSSSQYSLDSRKLKPQHSFDFPNNFLRKRSNSLQSLNSIDQKSNSKERKVNVKPVKAWTQKIPSEEKNFKTAFENWKNCSNQDSKIRLDYFKRKSIDIFLSRNLIEPDEILPSRGLKLNLPKTCDCNQTEINNDSDQEKKDDKNEKKVTFANDLQKPVTAETRRMNFRNSYSKRYTTNLSFSSPRLEKQNSISKSPTPRLDQKVLKRGNSLTMESSEDPRTTNCVSPNLKSPVQTDKTKQFAVKRKLKSCRSRSFHKSLDSSSSTDNVDLFFPKPVKPSQVDVVTMVSLLISNEDQEDFKTQSIKDDEIKESLEHKSKSTTGILKGKWQAENAKRITTPLQKRKVIIPPKSPEKSKSKTICEKTMESPKSDILCENSSEELQSQDSKSFHSAKEEECWSSFRKMSNKGFSVSFDTILRGLLTPTEYRLRRNELLTQE